MPQRTDSRPEDELRQRAIKRLRAKAGFWTHLVVYLAVNAFLVVIWMFTGSGMFWPVFPIVGWGIGVVANAWDVFGPEPVTPERVQREMNTCGGDLTRAAAGRCCQPRPVLPFRQDLRP